jgi:hypothetical protein
MKNNIIIKVLFIFLGIMITGCSSSNYDGNRYVKFIHLDTNTFVDYYRMVFNPNINNLNENDTCVLYLISKKEKNDSIDLFKYESLVENNIYCINLFSLDTPISAEMKRLNDRGGGVRLYIEDELFWDNGKIVAKVYFSNDIKGKYILKGKRK